MIVSSNWYVLYDLVLAYYNCYDLLLSCTMVYQSSVVDFDLTQLCCDMMYVYYEDQLRRSITFSKSFIYPRKRLSNIQHGFCNSDGHGHPFYHELVTVWLFLQHGVVYFIKLFV